MDSFLISGDARRIPLTDGTVQCIVTSPPYWGLRDYGLGGWDGGDAGCDHKVGRFEYPVNEKQRSNNGSAGHQAHDVCPRCGAVRHDAGIGLEPTLDGYIENMRAVGRELWRVLRDDGTLWLNMGDCYSASTKEANTNGEGASTLTSGARPHVRAAYNDGRGRLAHKVETGLKPKDLIGLPWRVAFALQADGWYLRSDMIWSKPNPMPESVRDRPTRAHEYLFLLAKRARYYYDAEAVREPILESSARRIAAGYNGKFMSRTREADPRDMRDVGMDADHVPNGRNRRTVWTIPTQPYRGAHFATFPEKLVEPCILAGSRPGTVVLDPFCGSGTVGVVAQKHGRAFVGMDLSAVYLELAKARIGKAPIGMGL